MLQIRLSNKGLSAEGGGAKQLSSETVTVACPDHLNIADLPVAKSIGTATAATLLKTVGRRSRRQLGERVHFCVSCDFPIAIYGRLSPCEHVFCLDCARSDSICHLCNERVQKIQTIKMMEGIFICAAPLCLKSFLKRGDFETHIHKFHSHLLQHDAEREDGNESEAAASAKQSAARPVFSPSGNSQLSKPMQQPKPGPFFGQPQSHPSEALGFDWPGLRFSQPGSDNPGGGPPQESGLLSDKQSLPPPTFVGPNPMPTPPFNYPPPPEGVQPFYNSPYDSGLEGASEQGSLLGFPPSQPMSTNFPANYSHHWNVGPAGVRTGSSSPGGRGASNQGDAPQGRLAAYFQGDNSHWNPAGMPLHPPPTKGMEVGHKDGKGVLAPQPMQLPPPPPLLPPHFSQLRRGKFYPGDLGRNGHGYRWRQERGDNFMSARIGDRL